MRLYCLRHGEAEAAAIDHDRVLSEQGRIDVGLLGEKLAQYGVHMGEVCHSGILRARQTAEIMAEKLGFTGALTEMSCLGGGAMVEPVAEQIHQWQDDSLIVSHMPFISELVSYLVTGQTHLTLMAYPPATLVTLERVKPGVWRILSILPPAVVRV